VTPASIAAIIGAVIGSAGFAAVINAFTARGSTRVQVTTALTGSAMELVNALKADSASAREDAKAAREETEALRHEVEKIRNTCSDLAIRLRHLLDMVVDPDMTMERLRIYVAQLPTLDEDKIG
jgi:FtsZ-binding cell division protein ZapB